MPKRRRSNSKKEVLVLEESIDAQSDQAEVPEESIDPQVDQTEVPTPAMSPTETKKKKQGKTKAMSESQRRYLMLASDCLGTMPSEKKLKELRGMIKRPEQEIKKYFTRAQLTKEEIPKESGGYRRTSAASSDDVSHIAKRRNSRGQFTKERSMDLQEFIAKTTKKFQTSLTIKDAEYLVKQAKTRGHWNTFVETGESEMFIRELTFRKIGVDGKSLEVEKPKHPERLKKFLDNLYKECGAQLGELLAQNIDGKEHFSNPRFTRHKHFMEHFSPLFKPRRAFIAHYGEGLTGGDIHIDVGAVWGTVVVKLTSEDDDLHIYDDRQVRPEGHAVRLSEGDAVAFLANTVHGVPSKERTTPRSTLNLFY